MKPFSRRDTYYRLLFMLFCLVAAAPETDAAVCPSQSAVRVTMRQFARQLLINKDPAGAYAAFASPDLVQRNPPFGATRDSTVAQWLTMTERPAASFRIVSMRLRGDVAHIRFMGSLGPGQRAQVDQHDRVRCGRIVEEWAEFTVLENKPPAD